MQNVSDLIQFLSALPKDAKIDQILKNFDSLNNETVKVSEKEVKASVPSDNIIIEEAKEEPKEEAKEDAKEVVNEVVETPKEEVKNISDNEVVETPKEEPYVVPEFLRKVYKMFSEESPNINFSNTVANAVLRNSDKKYVSYEMQTMNNKPLDGLYKVDFHDDGESVKYKYYNNVDKVNKPYKVELDLEGNILSKTWSPDMGKTIYRNAIVGYCNGAVLHYDPKVGKVIKEEYYTKDGKIHCEASLTYSE